MGSFGQTNKSIQVVLSRALWAHTRIPAILGTLWNVVMVIVVRFYIYMFDFNYNNNQKRFLTSSDGKHQHAISNLTICLEFRSNPLISYVSLVRFIERVWLAKFLKSETCFSQDRTGLPEAYVRKVITNNQPCRVTNTSRSTDTLEIQDI